MLCTFHIPPCAAWIPVRKLHFFSPKIDNEVTEARILQSCWSRDRKLSPSIFCLTARATEACGKMIPVPHHLRCL
jgi:hypothetical protein